jgi:hypothetical protein
MLVAAIALEGIPLLRSPAENRLVEEVVLWPAGFKVVALVASAPAAPALAASPTASAFAAVIIVVHPQEVGSMV